MQNVFVPKGASAHKLNYLAEWVRETIAKTESGELDVIRFIEIDLQTLFPDIYIHIEDDKVMGNRRAFISDDPLGLVVSESIYEGAENGCLFSKETILHEVGHLFLHHKYSIFNLNSANATYEDRIKDTNLANSAEWQASTFAICFIYPYRLLKDCRSVAEVRKRFPITHKQASRVLRHIQRLRKREGSRDSADERRWLKGIISALPEKKKSKRDQAAVIPSQLSFFANACELQSRQRQTASRPSSH